MKIIQGDSLKQLKRLESESIDCVITSPPYYALRDYGMKGQIGLEATPQEYVNKMIDVFDEIRRVLKKTGTCWVNMGDTYGGSGKGYGDKKADPKFGEGRSRTIKPTKGKGKCLLQVPARFAIAMTDRGWILRQEIIWAKPNPMPESVKDRCTRAHEYVFMFVKQKKYFYDAEAIKTPSKDPSDDRGARKNRKRFPTEKINGIRSSGVYPKANKRSVWIVKTKPYHGAHFAVFPEALIEPMVKAGSPRGGAVLDPFMGAGTTIVVAERLGRQGMGIELNKESVREARKRVKDFQKNQKLPNI